MRGPGRQRGGDRHALAFAARERPDAAVAQRLDVEQVEHLLHAPPHVRGVDAEVLHAVGELVLDAVEHERGRRDPAARTRRRRRACAGRKRQRVAPARVHAARERAAGEVRAPARSRRAGTWTCRRRSGRPRARTCPPRSSRVTSSSASDGGVGIAERDAVEAQRPSVTTSALGMREEARERQQQHRRRAATGSPRATATGDVEGCRPPRPVQAARQEDAGGERRGRCTVGDAGRRPRARAGSGCAGPGRARARPSTPASVTASSIPDSSTGTASDGSPRQRAVRMPAQPLSLAHASRPSRSCAARSRAPGPPPAQARGSAAGARRTTPNGSVTALKVPKTISSAARRAPSSAAYATLPASTVPRKHERGADRHREEAGEREDAEAPRGGSGHAAGRVDEPGHGHERAPGRRGPSS